MWPMHRMIVVWSEMTIANLGVTLHRGMGSSNLLLHEDVWVIMEALNHTGGVLLTILKGLAVPRFFKILLAIPLVVYLFQKFVLSEL